MTGGTSEIAYQIIKPMADGMKPLPAAKDNPFTVAAPTRLATPLGTKVGSGYTSAGGYNGLQV